jgi:hypothetical protein
MKLQSLFDCLVIQIRDFKNPRLCLNLYIKVISVSVESSYSLYSILNVSITHYSPSHHSCTRNSMQINLLLTTMQSVLLYLSILKSNVQNKATTYTSFRERERARYGVFTFTYHRIHSACRSLRRLVFYIY